MYRILAQSIIETERCIQAVGGEISELYSTKAVIKR